MRVARDTFLHFIADNLSGTTVHPLREDPNDPKAGLLQGNAVNISFLNISYNTDTCFQQVVIDVIYDDENTCVDTVQSVSLLLGKAYYTPLLDYTDPSNPALLNSNLYWDRERVQFQKIGTDSYCRYSCNMLLRFHL